MALTVRLTAAGPARTRRRTAAAAIAACRAGETQKPTSATARRPSAGWLMGLAWDGAWAGAFRAPPALPVPLSHVNGRGWGALCVRYLSAPLQVASGETRLVNPPPFTLTLLTRSLPGRGERTMPHGTDRARPAYAGENDALIFALLADAAGGAPGLVQLAQARPEPITVPRPQAWDTITIAVITGRPLKLDFNVADVKTREVVRDDLVLDFENGGKIVLRTTCMRSACWARHRTTIIQPDGKHYAFTELLAPTAGPRAETPGTRGDVVIVQKPPAGETQTFKLNPDKPMALNFGMGHVARSEVKDGNLVLTFKDGASSCSRATPRSRTTTTSRSISPKATRSRSAIWRPAPVPPIRAAKAGISSPSSHRAARWGPSRISARSGRRRSISFRRRARRKARRPQPRRRPSFRHRHRRPGPQAAAAPGLRSGAQGLRTAAGERLRSEAAGVRAQDRDLRSRSQGLRATQGSRRQGSRQAHLGGRGRLRDRRRRALARRPLGRGRRQARSRRAGPAARRRRSPWLDERPR